MIFGGMKQSIFKDTYIYGSLYSFMINCGEVWWKKWWSIKNFPVYWSKVSISWRNNSYHTSSHVLGWCNMYNFSLSSVLSLQFIFSSFKYLHCYLFVLRPGKQVVQPLATWASLWQFIPLCIKLFRMKLILEV